MISYFYMWEQRKRNLISDHKFFVSEGKARLTDQFSDNQKLEKEADEFAEKWLNEVSEHFDPDRHDPGDFYEQAHNKSMSLYFSLDELGNSARLAVISGMFHAWERELKKWLTSNDGLGHWHRGTELPNAIWRANFGQLFELFQYAGLFPECDPTRVSLDTCRLIVNTYKHGSGDSETYLKTIRPELFDQFDFRLREPGKTLGSYVDFEDLYVKAEHIDEFSDAIIAFWNAVPEHITDRDLSDVPDWFGRALQRDISLQATGGPAG